jgi:hypothetical protein
LQGTVSVELKCHFLLGFAGKKNKQKRVTPTGANTIAVFFLPAFLFIYPLLTNYRFYATIIP